MDSLTATEDWVTPIFDTTKENAPVPAAAPIVDLARLNLNDPFESAVWRMVVRFREKNHDYTPPGASPWWNFDRTESQRGLPFNESPLYEIEKKNARLLALRSRDTVMNESVGDSYEDIAVYGTIAYARFLYPNGETD